MVSRTDLSGAFGHGERRPPTDTRFSSACLSARHQEEEMVPMSRVRNELTRTGAVAR
jgi:hypothetical protein